MSKMAVVSWLIVAACVAGCDKLESEPIKANNVEGKMRNRRSSGEEVRVWRDPQTRCQYLLWERGKRGAMTPRLAPDGRPMCS